MFKRPFTVRLIRPSGAVPPAPKSLPPQSPFRARVRPVRPSFFRRPRLLRSLVFLFAGGLLVTIFLLVKALSDLPDAGNIAKLTAAQSSVILDRNGKLLYSIHAEENRTNVSLAQMSPYIPKAILAIEDDQFYLHGGFDLGGILRAVCYEARVCPEARGGSTITQQFVKNAFLSSERSYARKLKELILAIQLETRFTKDRILEMYLNRIPYGSNAFGVERAAQIFFNKSSKDLTLPEAAVLAAIPKAPSYFSPYTEHLYTQLLVNSDVLASHGIQDENDLSPQLISKGLLGKTYELTDEKGEIHSLYLKGRVDFVLERMEKLGMISKAEAEKAISESTHLVFKPYREPIEAPHFVFYVSQMLEARYGKEQIQKGGLRVTTTLDLDLQKSAQAAVERYAEMNQNRYNANNASLLALSPDSGEILAMVGSRDWNDPKHGKDNVALRPRSPGSSFKPIVYSAAFIHGYAPSTVVYDVKIKFSDSYSPENYDGKFRGPVTFRQALANSLNIPAIQAAYLAGIPNVLSLARNLGLKLNQPDDWYGLPIALGAGEVRLIDLVAAYGVFANGGHRVDPVALLKVEDVDGNILDEYTPSVKKEPLLDPQVAYLINDILSDSQAKPEGFWRDQLTIPGQVNGAKTGTSNTHKKNLNYTPSNPDSRPTVNVPLDAWTIGYTKRIAAGVWAGNNDGSALALKADGLGAASRIWHDFMVEATKNNPREEFDVPPGIKWVKVSRLSGKLPSQYTPSDQIVSEPFASFALPKATDDSYKILTIDKVSGKLATEYTPKEAIQEVAFYEHHSVFPDKPEWEDPVQEWVKENVKNEAIPTEYDDVHTPQTITLLPDIRITSPVALSVVSAPSVGVWVDVQATAGIEKVEYYWDDELADTVTTPPYKGTIAIDPTLLKGSTHILRARVFDRLYRSNQASVEVTVGEDTLPPLVRFDSLKTGDRLLMDSTLPIAASASDGNGDITHVDFYQDDVLKQSVLKPPYLFFLSVTGALGEHRLKAVAFDTHGHSKADEVSVLFASRTGDVSPQNAILFPVSGAILSEQENVLVQFVLDSKTGETVRHVALLTKDKNGVTQEITQLAVSQPTRYYTLPWSHPRPGNYELYAKITLKGGGVRFTKRTEVLVR